MVRGALTKEMVRKGGVYKIRNNELAIANKIKDL